MAADNDWVELKVTGSDARIPPRSVDTSVLISGFLAETRVTMVFKNESTTEGEGELTFPLDEGATVCGYAVDIDGQLVDAVVVEKEKARVAFETEVREKHAGPAIAETVSGNVFRTRIYPLPPHGTRTVRVRIASELSEAASGLCYFCPLRTRARVEHMRLSVQADVSLASHAPPLLGDAVGDALGRSSFVQDGSVLLGAPTNARYVFQAEASDVVPPAEIRVTVPRRSEEAGGSGAGVATTTEPIVLVEAGHENDPSTAFFCISQQVDVPPEDVPPREPVRRFGVIWDASRSRGCAASGSGAVERFAAMLRDIAARLESSLEEIALFTLATDLRFRGTFSSAQEVIDCVSKVEFNGATNISCITDLPAEDVAFYLLFSDGFETWGEHGKEITANAAVPIHAVCFEERADFSALKRIAASTAGTFFNLSKSRNDEQVADAVTGAAQLLFLRAEFNTNQCDEVFPGISTSIPPTGVFRVAGKLPTHHDDVPLKLIFGTDQTHVVRTLTYSLSPSKANTGLLARFWAQKKIESIQMQPESEETRKQVLAIGQIFGIVTSDTSLIVLNTLEQYLKYHIEPPAALAEIRREWGIRIKERQELDQQRKEQKFGRVCRAWKRRVAWFSAQFASGGDESTPRPLIRHFMDPTNLDLDASDQWGTPGITFKPKEPEKAVPVVAVVATPSAPEAPKKPEPTREERETMKRAEQVFVQRSGSANGFLEVSQLKDALEEVLDWELEGQTFETLTREHGVLFSGVCMADTFAQMAVQCSGPNGPPLSDRRSRKAVVHRHRDIPRESGRPTGDIMDDLKMRISRRRQAMRVQSDRMEAEAESRGMEEELKQRAEAELRWSMAYRMSSEESESRRPVQEQARRKAEEEERRQLEGLQAALSQRRMAIDEGSSEEDEDWSDEGGESVPVPRGRDGGGARGRGGRGGGGGGGGGGGRGGLLNAIRAGVARASSSSSSTISPPSDFRHQAHIGYSDAPVLASEDKPSAPPKGGRTTQTARLSTGGAAPSRPAGFGSAVAPTASLFGAAAAGGQPQMAASQPVPPPPPPAPKPAPMFFGRMQLAGPGGPPPPPPPPGAGIPVGTLPMAMGGMAMGMAMPSGMAMQQQQQQQQQQQPQLQQAMAGFFAKLGKKAGAVTPTTTTSTTAAPPVHMAVTGFVAPPPPPPPPAAAPASVIAPADLFEMPAMEAPKPVERKSVGGKGLPPPMARRSRMVVAKPAAAPAPAPVPAQAPVTKAKSLVAPSAPPPQSMLRAAREVVALVPPAPPATERALAPPPPPPPAAKSVVAPPRPPPPPAAAAAAPARSLPVREEEEEEEEEEAMGFGLFDDDVGGGEFIPPPKSKPAATRAAAPPPPPPAPQEEEEEDEDMGFGLFDGAPSIPSSREEKKEEREKEEEEEEQADMGSLFDFEPAQKKDKEKDKAAASPPSFRAVSEKKKKKRKTEKRDEAEAAPVAMDLFGDLEESTTESKPKPKKPQARADMLFDMMDEEASASGSEMEDEIEAVLAEVADETGLDLCEIAEPAPEPDVVADFFMPEEPAEEPEPEPEPEEPAPVAGKRQAPLVSISLPIVSVASEPLPLVPSKGRPRIQGRFSFKEDPRGLVSLPPELSAMRGRDASGAYKALMDVLRNPEHRDNTQLHFAAIMHLFSLQTPQATGAALEAISNLAELFLDNTAPLRLAGYLCMQAGLLDAARNLFERVLRLRPEEPQSFRDLAVVLNALFGSSSGSGGSNAKAERSLSLLNSIVEKEWDVRFDQVELVALMDMNSIYHALARAGLLAFVKHNVFADFVSTALEADIRVVLSWTADGADVDLLVKDPQGETCSSMHNATASGGMQSRDMPGGFGPVEFLQRDAKPGNYEISARLFFSPAASGMPVFVMAHVFTNWGRADQAEQVVTRVFPKGASRPTVSFGTIHVN